MCYTYGMTGTQATGDTDWITEKITRHDEDAQYYNRRTSKLTDDDHSVKVANAAEGATRAAILRDVLTDLMASLRDGESLTQAIETIASNY